MSSAAVMDRELMKELRAEGKVFKLYNPANTWLPARFADIPYPLCPDGEAVDIKTNEVRTTDGVTEIRDRWGKEWAENEERKRFQTGNETIFEHAHAIVAHILKKYPFVVRLTGDAKKDELRKAEARKKWIDHRLKWAQQVIAERDTALAAFKANPSNAGQIPDPPNALEQEAIEFMAEYRLGRVGKSTFACRHEGYRTDDQEKWHDHVRAFHPDEFDALTKGAGEKGDSKKKK